MCETDLVMPGSKEQNLFMTCCRPFLLLGLIALPAACGSVPSGGQTGAETSLAPCANPQLEELPPGQATDWGLSAEELLMTAAGRHQAPWLWADGATTPATLQVDEAEGPRTQSRGANTACPSELSVPVRLRFTTADGSFDEVWNGLLLASDVSEIGVLVDQPVTKLSGSFVPSQLMVPQLSGEKVDSYLPRFRVSGGEASGVIELTVESEPSTNGQLVEHPAPIRVGTFGDWELDEALDEPSSLTPSP